MLSYLHSFHAGNHADILKHITLLYTQSYFNKKNKPYTIFDTHSGRALYDLSGIEACKTKEALNGIERLLEDVKYNKNYPQELNSYIDFVLHFLDKGFYPGSPCYERSLLNNGSSLFLTELHKSEYQHLEQNISKIEKYSVELKEFVSKGCYIKIENRDGFSLLKTSLPPVIKRGFILCDPSYEEKSDYINASEILSYAHKKWSAATILLWYPLLSNRKEEIDGMKQSILSTVKNRDNHTEVLDATLLVDTPDSHIETSLTESIGSEKPRLYGSGMFVINPCWNTDQHLIAVLPYLAKLLGRQGKGSYSVQML